MIRGAGRQLTSQADFVAVTKSGVRHRLAAAYGVDELLLQRARRRLLLIDRKRAHCPRLS